MRRYGRTNSRLYRMEAAKQPLYGQQDVPRCTRCGAEADLDRDGRPYAHCPKCRAYMREKGRESYRRRKARCVGCGGEVDAHPDGRPYRKCRPCRRKNAERCRERYDRLRAEGRCVGCGGPTDGDARCRRCEDDNARRQKAWRARKEAR